jgi:hypothetical protein
MSIVHPQIARLPSLRPDPKQELPLICESKSFPVKKTLLMEKFSLFLEKPQLLGADSYAVQAKVRSEVFEEFLRAMSGNQIAISAANAHSLLDLCNEFGFDAMSPECDRVLRSNPSSSPNVNLNLNSIPSAPAHVLEERISRQGLELATVFHEVAVLRKSFSEIRDPLSTRSTTADLGTFDYRFASLEQEISALRQRLESEQLYRRRQECLFGDHQFGKSTKLGLSYLERSLNGRQNGQNSYGYTLQRDKTVPTNLVEGARYFKLSADQSNLDGLESYGGCLACGDGVPKSVAQALIYYRCYADRGDSDAKFNYALMMRDGILVPKDLIESAWYFKMAADQGGGFSLLHYERCGWGIEISQVCCRAWPSPEQGMGQKIPSRVIISVILQRLCQAK